MSARRSRRNPLFADSLLESRLSPGVISYPIAPSIVEFDPVGDREENPALPEEVDNFEIICDPEIDLIQVDSPVLDISDVA